MRNPRASRDAPVSSDVRQHMTRVLELHDSVVSSVTLHGSDVVVVLNPAYVHESAQRPAVDPGTVYTQAVELRFAQATWTDTLPVDVEPELSSGIVQFDGHAFDNIIPLPFEARGSVKATLAYGYLDAVLEVKGFEFRCKAVGPAHLLEAFPGAV